MSATKNVLFLLFVTLCVVTLPSAVQAQTCPDADGDGYTDIACGGTDCDDTDPNVHPGAVEVCDGKDTNCDGVRWQTDYDRDGDGVPGCAGDCNDNDPAVYPGAPELCDGVDNNCDNTIPLDERDLDGDGVRLCDNPPDCNDSDATSYPGAAELCADGKDNNCDGVVDETPCTCPDRDGDGHTDAACGGDDCDDSNGAIYPGAPEVCTDGVDNNCNGQVDCSEAACASDATCLSCAAADQDGDGYSTLGGVCGLVDCDDTDPNVHPGATEVCDGKDTNCDGVRWQTDYDRDGDGVPGCAGDCNDTDPTIYPGALELCDGKDNNCDNTIPIDERDLDGDGVRACDNPPDCNDTDATSYPGATEVCGDGKDNNCNGSVDEVGCVCPDRDGDGHSDAACGGDDCDDSNSAIYPGAAEMCTDGVDNNCNGQVDCSEATCTTDPTCVSCTTADQDGDGYSTLGGVCGPVDCDDNDPTVHPGAAEVCDGKDTNCDGIRTQTDYDRDGDGVPGCAGDCNDTDPTIYPGAPELCDGVDNNCDNTIPIDERDLDGDGVRACDNPPDCNDTDPTSYPGATEVCGDGKDNNCNGVVDEALCNCDDRDGDGYLDAACGGDDCDDSNSAIYPGAVEVCTDGVDNNCNGQVDCSEPACAGDPTCVSCVAADQDGDGYSTLGGVCGAVDCDDNDPNVYPGATEVCDGKDTNCDGVRPQDDYDLDGDGVPACAGDCNDNDPTVYPGAPELCDGVDNDCDGTVPSNELDGDGDGVTGCAGDCNDNDPGIHPGATEICGNGIDEDCDGVDPACTVPINYWVQIQPIFSAKCVRCHHGKHNPPNLRARHSCSNLVGMPASCAGKTLVVPNSSATSYLIDKVTPDGIAPACGAKMPSETTGLTQAEADLIVQWIDQGASCAGGGTGGNCIDNDGDGYGAPGDRSCPHGAHTDCDDNDPAINPGATEILGNGIDDDCNGNTRRRMTKRGMMKQRDRLRLQRHHHHHEEGH